MNGSKPHRSVAESAKEAPPEIATGLTGPKDALARAFIKRISEKSLDISTTDVPAMVESIVRILPRQGTNRIAQKVGPCYPEAVVAKWAGITRQAVAKRAAANKILLCQSAEGDRLYPAWQFSDDARTIAGLPEVLAALATGRQDGWTAALWLLAPSEPLAGQSAIDWLRTGGSVATVVTLASRRAARWAA